MGSDAMRLHLRQIRVPAVAGGHAGELVVEVESTVRRPHLSRRDRAAAGALRRHTRREAQGSSPWGHD